MTNFLRRYTELPFLFHILRTKKLTLLNPKFWDDRNDAHHIDSYKTKKGLQSVLALCFTEAPETYHHWKVFSGNSSGVCIDFNKEQFVKSLKAVTGLRSNSVDYRKIRDVRGTVPNLIDLPFLKRYPFRDEKEFRLIFEESISAVDFKDVDLDLTTITKVVINPWMPKVVFSSVKKSIQEIPGCAALTVNRTTLVDNDEWKHIGSTAA